jgi:CheY-like chemotaxis protein
MRILAAEDNVVNQRVITRMIERLGHEVHVVGDGAQALEALGRESYDLILMDLQMPVMDGFQATATVRRSVVPISGTPVIALTANAVQGDREQCLAAGMDDYLSKPIILEDLAAALERWSPRNRTASGQVTTGQYPVIE